MHMLQLRACTEYPSAVGAKSAKCKPCSRTHACAHVCVHVCAATCMLPKPSRAMQPLNPSPLLLLTPPLPFALPPNKALHCSCAPQHQGHPPPPRPGVPPAPTHGHTQSWQSSALVISSSFLGLSELWSRAVYWLEFN